MTAYCNLLPFQVISLMENADNFKKFVSDLIDGKATSKAIEFIAIILRNWCRKNKLEAKWMAFDNKFTGETEFCEMILSETREIIQKNEIDSYNNYKSIVIESAEEILNKGFKNFNQLLLEKNNLAWKYVTEQLMIYALKWYKTRNYSMDIDIIDLHWAAMNTLFEKQYLKKLKFNNSFELKSYYFRILENKMKEQFRKIKRENLLSREIPDLPGDVSNSEEDDLVLYLKQEIKKLSENEQFIVQEYFVYEKKLTEIAEKLNISAENCRVIKHRIMKRLFEKIQAFKKLVPSG